MSWSVYAVGRPAAVKAKIKEEFARIKPNLVNMPHEHASAALTEEILDTQLNFFIENGITIAVKIEASGHAWKTEGQPFGDSNQRLIFETIPGFVE